MAKVYTCVICCRPVPQYEPEFCCSGFDPVTQLGCGCHGNPIYPCVCSAKCLEACSKYIGMPFEQRRVKAGIPLRGPDPAKKRIDRK